MTKIAYELNLEGETAISLRNKKIRPACPSFS